MLLVVGTFRLPADMLDDARPVMARMIAASHAEPGCLAYSYAQDLIDPGLIHVHEQWVDQAAFDAHVAMPHLAEWRAAWPDLGITDRDLRAYDVGDPRPV